VIYHYHVVYFFITEEGNTGNGSMTVSAYHTIDYASDIEDVVTYVKSKSPFIKKAVIINLIPLKGFERERD
jgi:hypothetical protein